MKDHGENCETTKETAAEQAKSKSLSHLPTDRCLAVILGWDKEELSASAKQEPLLGGSAVACGALLLEKGMNSLAKLGIASDLLHR